MNRYILRATTNESNSINEVNDVLKAARGNIIDDSAFPKMILVESELDLVKIADTKFLNNWKILPEEFYEIPEKKPFIKKSDRNKN